jgi:hypothetical protein
LAQVPAGKVTEILIHPGDGTPEMQASADDWRVRSADTDFVASPRFQALLRDNGIRLIGYRHLRQLQRASRAAVTRR